MIAATAAPSSVASACSFDKFTATASEQVQLVAACATAVGDVTIKGDKLDNIELTGVQAIYGNLDIENVPQAKNINAPDLQVVSKDFIVLNGTILSNINVAKLSTVGSLQLNALPALSKVDLSSGLTTADKVIISDTGLSSLEGINVFKLKVFDVNNNGDIETIKSGLQQVTERLSISYNSPEVDVSLDQLESVADLNLQKIKSVSAKNLTSVNGTLAITETSVKDVDFPQLSSVKNSLELLKNDELDGLDFPLLGSIGGALNIGDNDKLEDFGGFPNLTQIGGSVNINGSFNNGSFPELKRVAGGFTLLSEDGDLKCEDFKKLNSDGIVKGDKFACKGKDVATSSSLAKSGNKLGVSQDDADSIQSDSSTESGDGKDGKDGKDNGAAGLSMSYAAIVAGFVAVGASLLY